MSQIFRQSLLLILTLAVFSGCQSGSDTSSSSSSSSEDDLKKLGLAYVSYQDEKQESPSGWDELMAFAEEEGLSADAIQRVRDAGYTVTWGLEPNSPDAGATVLAQPPGEGRKLMADGGLEE